MGVLILRCFSLGPAAMISSTAATSQNARRGQVKIGIKCASLT
jgi:hypothetical protein